MDNQIIKELETTISDIRKSLSYDIGGSTMDLVDDLIEKEILLAKECNK